MKHKPIRQVQVRASRLQRELGISVEQFDKMYEKQKGTCAICNLPERTKFNGKPRRLSIDHDHKTGKVRELLCSTCNAALGYVNDNPELLQKMVEYLRRHSPTGWYCTDDIPPSSNF